MSAASLKLQSAKIEEYRNLKEPYAKRLAGLDLVVMPNVYPGGSDSELLAQSIIVDAGDNVLDLCTGNGIVAIKAALNGAAHVLGTDLNPAAINNARRNKARHHLANVEFIETNLFPDTRDSFDVITINPPYSDHLAPDYTASCFWDKDNSVTRSFFAGLSRYLKPGGTAYITWSSFADQHLLGNLARQHNLDFRQIAATEGKSGFTYFVCSVKRRF